MFVFNYMKRKKIFTVLLSKILLLSGAISFMVTSAIIPCVASSLIVPLTVSNQLDIERIQEPITTGIPLPVELGITHTRSLRVTTSDGQAAVDTQFRVLSRWGELTDKKKPIKWVLVDFQADVPAKGKAIYYLTTVESGSEKARTDDLEGIIVTEDDAYVVVDTGPLKFRISKDKFNLFDQVIVKDPQKGRLSQLQVENHPSSPPSQGGDKEEIKTTNRVSHEIEQLPKCALGKELVSSSLQNGIRIDRGDKTYRSSYNRPDTMKIEENGPLRTVIHIRGKLQNENGDYFVGGDARQKPNKGGRPKPNRHPLEYNVRIHAYKDKSYVKVFYTLENNGNGWGNYEPSNDVFIDGLYLDLKTNSNNPISFISQSVVDNLGHNDTLDLLQTHSVNNKHDESKNFSYIVIKNRKPLFKGERSEGWMDLSDGDFGIAVGMKYFWQNYPKSIEINGSTISMGLLPDYDQMPEEGHYSEGNYYFSGGWHKTHELLYYFHDTVKSRAEIEEVVSSFKAPMIALAPAGWYADTKAWSLIAPRIRNNDSKGYLPHYGMLKGSKSLIESDPGDLQKEALGRYEQMNQVLIDPEVSVDHIDLEKMRESRGSFHFLKGKGWVDCFKEEYYGWENFGDLVWKWNQAGNYCALHYDWPYIMWLQMIRSGDIRYFGLAEEMTRHSVDMDQIHTETTGLSQYINGLWWWESMKGRHKSGMAAGMIVSHTWNGGYSLGYLLTGNERYLEAARRSANVGRNYWFDKMGVGKRKVVFDQTRSQGWSILMLVNFYKITGNVKLLKEAMTIFTNSLLYTEQLSELPGSNGRGYIALKEHNEHKGKVVVTFATYHLEPLCELHYEAIKAGLDVKELGSFLIRSLNWLKNYAYVGGEKNVAEKYSALTISYSTDPNDPSKNKGGTIAHNIHVAGAFGYGYTMLKNSNPTLAQSYLYFARHLFRDLMFYTQAGMSMSKDNYFDPNIRAPIKYLYHTSATKEMGYIGRGGQFYLNAEYNLQNGKEDSLQAGFDTPLEENNTGISPGEQSYLNQDYELEKSEENEIQLEYDTSYQSPELVWLQQEADLTKHTKGPFTVKIRVEGVDKQGSPSTFPRILYYIGTRSSYGYFDMIHEDGNVWKFDIPDPEWYRYRSNSLHYQVKLFDEDGSIITESRWEIELIDSFVQKR